MKRGMMGMKVVEIGECRVEYVVGNITIKAAAAKYGRTEDQVQLWDGSRLVAYAVWRQGDNHYSYCRHPELATGPAAGPSVWDKLRA